MPKQKLMNSKQFQIGEQWQHKETLETVTIMGTSPYQHDSAKFNVSYLTQYGTRLIVRSTVFIEEYTYIPHMKGAYH